MADFVSPIIKPVLDSLLVGVKRALRERVLNIKDDTLNRAVKWLRKGDELCRGRTTPMSSQLTKQVRDIYKKCKSSKGVPPLMMALDTGLTDMVWGFIECAKQTDTNLHTGQKGDVWVKEFFWLPNKYGETAFDVAIEKDHMEVVRLLLNNAPPDCLTSQWNRRREALLHLLNDPKSDSFIFDMLEAEKEEGPRSTSVNINRQPEQLKIYNNGEKRIVTPEFLDNLGNVLLGSNASNNTVLHLVSTIGNVASIKYILEAHPSQIYSCNSNMETPAYVAAREGRVDALRYMINLLKKENGDIESILTRSTDKHNALHMAIQNHHVEVVFLLIEEIPQLANCINESQKSPLYLAAERGYAGIVKLILKKCKEISFEGPNGKTALHAAAISNSAECVEDLLHKNISLLNCKDYRGRWTPLHHAIYHNSWLATTKLLDVDYSIGYHELILNDGINTSSAIHLAASLGHCETIKVLMDLCPGCSEFIDKEGRDILHVAVESKRNKAIEFIFGENTLTNLINQKDKNGNTPIHLLCASHFEKMEMLMDSRVDMDTLNNEKLTPLEMLSSEDQRDRLIKAMTMGSRMHDNRSALSPKSNKSGLNEIHSEAKEQKTDRHFVIVDNLVVVAALIATASYAAAFTVPGGFNGSEGSKQGTPFLLRKPAFQAFIITNAIAFASSCSVLLEW